jgi:microcystin-dependent protein
MKINVFYQGGHPLRLDDLLHLQNGVEDNVANWAKAQGAVNDNFILHGAEVALNSGNWETTEGAIVLNGEILPHEAQVLAEVPGELTYWEVEETFTGINPRTYEDTTTNNVNAVRVAKLNQAVTPPAGYLAGDGISYQELTESLTWNIGDIKTSAALVANFDPITFIGLGRKYRNWQLCSGGSVLDARGRTMVGLDPADTDLNAVGKIEGAKTHSLTSIENGPHTHTLADPGHYHTQGTLNYGVSGPEPLRAAGTTLGSHDLSATTTGSQTTGITVNSNGSGTGHNNMQPSIAVLMMQKIS